MNPQQAIGWIVVVAFALTCLVTIGALLNWVSIEPRYKGKLFTALILEIVAAGFFLFYAPFKQPTMPDLTGEWTYQCDTGVNEAVGGEFTVFQDHAKITISGRRMWIRRGTATQQYQPAVHWSSQWVAVNEGILGFSYTINPPGQTPEEGFAYGDLNNTSRPTFIKGKYYVLPPAEDSFGEMEMRRK